MPYTGVSGQWTVPTLASNSPQGSSSSWVGIDGNGTATLIQAGTAQNVTSPTNTTQVRSYYPWYQIVPSHEVMISKPVYAGDVIQVKIIPLPGTPLPTAGTSSPWSIQMTDVTQNWFYSATENYAGPLSSVEWIEERPSTPRLADYVQVEFNFGNQVARGSGPLTPVQLGVGEEVWMNDGGENGVFSTPSNPSDDKEGFFVTWTSGLANQVFPPGPWIQTTSVPPAQLNMPYSQTLLVNEATSPKWTFSGYLPPGVTFNQLTGVLSGTPTNFGTFNFSVFATDTSNGAYTSTVPLILTVNKASSASLQVTCTEFGPIAPTGINVTVDSVAEACSTPIILSTGLHTVVGTPFGTPGPFKVTYSGSCNAAGQVTLAQSDAATCVVAAQTLSSSQSACPQGQHCCEPSATGCLKCVSNTTPCP
jgi:hypothetical protein